MELLDAGTLPIMRGPGDLMNMNHRNDQAVRRCSDMEMDGLECMAAYGALRGRKVCKTLVEDYKECVRSLIQVSIHTGFLFQVRFELIFEFFTDYSCH